MIVTTIYRFAEYEEAGSTIDQTSSEFCTTAVKPYADNECRKNDKIDQSSDVYLFLKDNDFSLTNTRDFGLYLTLTNAELDNLKEESGGKATEFLNKVVQRWFNKFPSACWETIHDALIKLPNVPLASKVKQNYMTDY